MRSDPTSPSAFPKNPTDPAMKPRFSEQVALVTGAATGIGAAIARRFRAECAQVVAAGLQRAELEAHAAQIGALAIECDVTDDKAVHALIERTLQQYGRLDTVVNVAGVAIGDYAADIDDCAWTRMLQINLEGTMRVCRAAIPALKRSGGGSIVNVASVAAFNSTPGWASYSVSKAGVVSLTRSIANAYGQDGIRANCLCPGLTRTQLTEKEAQASAAARGISSEKVWEELAAQTALKRIALPEDVAGCALFLASADAAFVTGACLIADGGAKFLPTVRAI